MQYGDWLTPGEIKSIEELEKGCGAILREGLKKIAVCTEMRRAKFTVYLQYVRI